MKKYAAIITALVLSVTVLSGCSISDVGLVSLYKESVSLKSFSVSGDMAMEIDPNAIYSSYYYYERNESPVTVRFSISGDVVYSSFDDIFLDLKINYGVNTKDKPYEANLLLYNNVLYMPVKDYIDFGVETVYKLDDEYSDNMRGKLKAAFLNGLSAYDYVILGDTSDVYNLVSMMGPAYYDEITSLQEKSAELIFKAVTSMLSGFSSGLTKAVPGGFALEVTSEKAVDAFGNLLKYISDNKKTIAPKLVDLYYALYGGDEYMAEYGPDEEDVIEFLGYIDEYGPGEWDLEYAKLLFKGSFFNASITKQGNVYKDNIDLAIFYRGEKFITVKGGFTKTARDDITQQTVSTSEPIIMEDADSIIEKIEREINYVKNMKISWRNWSYNSDDGYLWTDISIEKAEGSSRDYFDCYYESGSLFVPMREVLEWWGEEVVWDNVDKKAYVVRGGQRTEMEGKLMYKTMYIKARELEKLGYTVSYTYEEDDWGYGSHVVTVSR